MHAVQFANASLSFRLRNKTTVRKWMEAAAKNEGYSLNQLSIIFMTDDELLGLNRRFLNHDELTDILTFDLKTQKQKVIEGEIYISLERVRENAGVYSKSVSEELHRVMIHGLLHLCGYHDKTPKQKNEMRNREDYYLSKLNRMLKRK